MKYNTATPYIASYVIAKKNGKIAFLLRTNTSWMNGFYGLASGKVEKGESFVEAAIREAKEEIGIIVKPENLKPIMAMHRQGHEPGHQGMTWVDMFFEAETWEGELINAEPDLHGELEWFDSKKLPKNVIPSLRFAIEQIDAGKTYCEYGW